tara:strand:+ start:333 stop:677 length:345 start_codon:yes stop_codon:yes gene_type:complete
LKSFLVQPFHQRVHVTTASGEFIAKYNRHCTESEKIQIKELDQCRGMAVHLDEGKPLFMLYLPGDVSCGTLFHECLHMAHFIMDYASAPVSLESTETQAYLMENIAATVRKKIE